MAPWLGVGAHGNSDRNLAWGSWSLVGRGPLRTRFLAVAPDFPSSQAEVRKGLAFLREDWMPRLRFFGASGPEGSMLLGLR